MSAEFLNQSAAITSFKTVSGRNVVLAFQNPTNYKTNNGNFFGATIGRVANRIYGGHITVRDKTYPLDINDKGNNATLHGGFSGWDKSEWSKMAESEDQTESNTRSCTFTHVSPHLDQGFPGTVEAQVAYRQYVKDNKSYLEMEYTARLADDSPVDETVVSMTNHTYFNVAGDDADTCNGTEISLASNKYLVHDSSSHAPTGTIEDFPGIPKDPSFFTLSDEAPAIDHCFVVDPRELAGGPAAAVLDTRTRQPKLHVHMRHPSTKLNVEVWSTEPVFQVYTGDGNDRPKLEGEMRAFASRSGIAVEPARPTNAATMDQWRPWVTLKKGQVYGSKILYVCYEE